ncbi:ABC transporter permease [Thorsellia anophelis]|uniref:Ribose transport system permease protein n=1 Tax=Thorsellia anophelis DSM 18579 TaxID=1123402 RepID=A0A1I0B946_9GAMM|nr:sugar ABC transporter permease [Thorsellia anophelis]SET03235.1 ribose transport system permease protein [Thorsellia anophelis DSM 18579]
MNTSTQSLESVNQIENGIKSRFIKYTKQPAFYPFVGLLILFIFMSLFNDSFFTKNNITNILRQVSINAIIAVGMTFAILKGGIDLSVGAVMALAGTVTATLLVAGIPIPLAIIAGIIVGALFGFANGFCIAIGKMPPIIVTFATMGIARGFALLYTGGYPISGLPSAFDFLGKGVLFGIQVPIIIMAIVFIIAYMILVHLPFGRHVYAIGGNEESARLSGIKVVNVKLWVYIISGTCAAIAGIVLTSRLMSAQPNSGLGFELDAIAAVVLGGAAISGGKGTIIGTLVGAILLGVLSNGLNLMDVSSYLQNVIKGCIILCAIYLSSNKNA